MMIKELTEQQNSKAVKLFKSSIALANLSLNKIINNPVQIKEISVSTREIDDPYTEQDAGLFVQVIKTPLIGEIQGNSYLFLTESDIDSIFTACLPEDIHTDDSMNSENMKQGLLTEIGNMMVAAFVTEIADSLEVEVYGSIPVLETIESFGSNIMIGDLSDNQEGPCLVVKASLKAKTLEISPDFVWVLPMSLLEYLR